MHSAPGHVRLKKRVRKREGGVGGERESNANLGQILSAAAEKKMLCPR